MKKKILTIVILVLIFMILIVTAFRFVPISKKDGFIDVSNGTITCKGYAKQNYSVHLVFEGTSRFDELTRGIQPQRQQPCGYREVTVRLYLL